MSYRAFVSGILTVLVVLGAAVAVGAGEVRHSGRVVEVTGDRLVLEEIVAWKGPGTGRVRREIRLTPSTSVQLVWRSDRDWDRTPKPGYESAPLRVSEIRPGDFVTVTTDGDRRAVAVSMEVIRPEGGR